MATANKLDLIGTRPGRAETSVGRSPRHDGRRKDALIATVAHELRQPLSAMLAAVEVVQAARDIDAARRAAHVMRRQISQMSRLVEDLVDAARWANGKVTLRKRRLDLRDVIRDAAADVGTMADGYGQELSITVGPDALWIDGDSQRLLQAVSNLLRNAVNYTQTGGRISIVVERIDSTIRLHVVDTGRGIEAEALPHVFDLFSQTRPQEGIGLGVGLNVVREIVLLHGGTIEARSDGVRKGTEFIVSLPLAEMPTEMLDA
jgi:two-component system, sensor histidine kinase